MESQKSPPALNSLTERKSRLLMLTKLERNAAGETKRAIVGRLAGLPPKLRKTISLFRPSLTSSRLFFILPHDGWRGRPRRQLSRKAAPPESKFLL